MYVTSVQESVSGYNVLLSHVDVSTLINGIYLVWFSHRSINDKEQELLSYSMIVIK